MTAGLDSSAVPQVNPRRELIKSIRSVIRRQDATDDEMDDALEALVELSKE
jgi:hypothetical protein